jgi:hypothetical protein
MQAIQLLICLKYELYHLQNDSHMNFCGVKFAPLNSLQFCVVNDHMSTGTFWK